MRLEAIVAGTTAAMLAAPAAGHRPRRRPKAGEARPGRWAPWPRREPARNGGGLAGARRAPV